MLGFTSNQAAPILPGKMLDFLRQQGVQAITESERKYN